MGKQEKEQKKQIRKARKKRVREMVSENNAKLNGTIDFWTLALSSILVIFGIVMVFSASYYSALNEIGMPFFYLKRQVIFAIFGYGLMWFFATVDYHLLERFNILIMLVTLALLALVLVRGNTANGATRWLAVGPITIMPGEVAKFSMIVFTATFYARNIGRAKKFWSGIVPVVLMTGIVAGLIIMQPNLSTAMTVVFIVVVIMFLAGLPYGYIIAGLGAGVAGFIALAFSGTYWSARITSFLDPFQDAVGDGYQVVQSLLALGTGGLWGLGLGKSIQKNLYLPYPHNDFILAIIGEELGLVGILIMLLVFVLLIWRILLVAMRAKDRFGMLMAGGIAAMIGIQVILNVAIVTSSMPPTGVALPFITYGGNALWICMSCIGIVLNISKQANKQVELKAQKDQENESNRNRRG